MLDQKTIEGLEWVTPPENQGQAVTISYANDGECVFQKITHKGYTPWLIAYRYVAIDSIYANEEWPWELCAPWEWEYEPWNQEPIIPEFLWKEVTNA